MQLLTKKANDFNFQDNCKLNAYLNTKTADLEKVTHKLSKSSDLIKKYEYKLAEQSNQLESSILKYSEEAKNVNVYETNYNLVAEKLKVRFISKHLNNLNFNKASKIIPTFSAKLGH